MLILKPANFHLKIHSKNKTFWLATSLHMFFLNLFGLAMFFINHHEQIARLILVQYIEVTLQIVLIYGQWA